MRERLAVSKQAAQKFDGERFQLGKLNEPEVKEKYQIEITNRFAALENLNVDEDVNRESGLSQTAHSPSKHKDKHGFIILQCKHTEL